MKNLNLNYLKTFVDLAKTLNFSKTAQNLSVAQPAVSRQIKELEAQLGKSLFIRDNKKVHLSSTGLMLKQSLTPLLESLGESISMALDKEGTVKGHINFACPQELGELLVIPIINQFSNLYPEVTFNILFTKANEIPEALLRGEIDFGICLNPLDHENLKFYKVIDQESYLLTNKESEKTGALRKLRYIGYRKNDPLIETYIRKFSPRSSLSKIEMPMTMNSHKAIVEYIARTKDYYAVLPYYSAPVIEALKRKDIRVASEKKLKGSLYFVMVDHEYTSAKNQLFKDFFIKEIKN
ncbi:LysR family transcriptional regulator [Halobacteriovorax sp. GB3]|uniref:LysR family transcriptional regulator n=1 Tax=Halobacteriovorax sp. GB3 TaxID=2719615 RepID=UPI00235E28A7|nr:LysR family transcriptional regulator [Halobacteriovorax sp. GB3]MDD0851737.1 LysR family transcriptional regulator [Halobacteriovorax sp. GB3]